MNLFTFTFGSALLLYISFVKSTNIVLTNDDGWAVAMIRAQNSALLEAGYDVVLSAPAENESGTGSSTATPTVLTEPCEFNTCPTGSPPEGFNASDPRLNYVNAFPVDSVRFGIQTLSPQFFGGSPDFVVSGPNVGNNLGTATVGISGTVGAACEAAKEGIPSTAFSAAGLSQVSFTDLNNNNADTSAALVFSQLTVNFVNALLADGPPFLPSGISLNVNYPASTSSSCASPFDFSFVLTRIAPNSDATDVETCGTDHLPGESAVVATSGCFASVSVMNATSKADVGAATQAFVLNRLDGFLSCLP
ncbi:sure-like protein [Lentinula raphanica]|uniref:Sure-like protein n=1 Tax=Lentinula raphanica TaxID=153919 RepID=A0AA38NXG1_9AGAR|nr:sure-like protein [Lentinula raphanica]KAJ3969706.1 sure-like protein [Lentinula raphanica]